MCSNFCGFTYRPPPANICSKRLQACLESFFEAVNRPLKQTKNLKMSSPIFLVFFLSRRLVEAVPPLVPLLCNVYSISLCSETTKNGETGFFSDGKLVMAYTDKFCRRPIPIISAMIFPHLVPLFSLCSSPHLVPLFGLWSSPH